MHARRGDAVTVQAVAWTPSRFDAPACHGRKTHSSPRQPRRSNTMVIGWCVVWPPLDKLVGWAPQAVTDDVHERLRRPAETVILTGRR
jgi:hypothetical protein